MLVSTVQEQFLALLKKQWLPPAALLFFAAGYILFVKTGWFLLPLSNALWGIIFTLSVCFCYSRFLPRKILETAGTYSFSLYLLQYFFIFPVYLLLARSISLPGPWIVPCTFAAGLAGPLFMIFYVFPHSRVLSLLLSGNEKMPARQQ
jgi:peptidoglycan/LPS O-acetylase OafA/YrhL